MPEEIIKKEMGKYGRVEKVAKLLEKLYKKLWWEVGGKPWTELVREDQRRSPLLYMLIFLGLGILVSKLAGRYWWQILLGLLVGVIIGHLFWTT